MKPNVEYRGKIDLINESVVAGWAAAVGEDNQPVDLIVSYDDLPIGTVRADGSRDDLLSVGKGACAFEFKLPAISNFNPDQLTVSVKDTSVFLNRAWVGNHQNGDRRTDLTELTEAVVLTRKILLAASSRNERALIGMTETMGKITPKQITDSLHSLSYQQMQTKAELSGLQASVESILADQHKLLEQARKARSTGRWTLVLLVIALGTISAQVADWAVLAELVR